MNKLTFAQGRTLTVSGTAGVDDRQKILDFYEKLSKTEVRNQPLFAKVQAPDIRNQPGTQLATWAFAAELTRTDTTE